KVDVAVLCESFDLFQITVVKPLLHFREAVLGDPNQVAGSERNRPGFINLKPGGLVQGKQRSLITLVLHPNATLLILTGHRDPFTAPETGSRSPTRHSLQRSHWQ